MPTVNIYDAIHVSLSKKWEFPFNLNFQSTIKDDRVKGPGVYMISFKGNPIYFGKYQPFNRNNIFADRWLRHIETITLRGERVGFGNNSTLNKVLPTVCDDLKTILSELSEGEALYRFRDTGVCSSKERRKFASQHWDKLSTATPENILKDFDFRYYKIYSIKDATHAKEITSNIEECIINQFYFPINDTKGYTDNPSINTVESRVFELVKKCGLEVKLELHLSN